MLGYVFGIGNDFPKGAQVDYVLGPFTDEQERELPQRLDVAEEIIRSFVLCGIQNTMNQFNNK